MAEVIVGAVSLVVDQLGSGAYKNIMFARDLNSHIKKLQQLKTTIEAALLDARSLESYTNTQKDVFEKLDCALADLVNFLDAKAAKAKQKEIMQGNKFIKQVRLFFSKSNQLVTLFRDAHKLKAIIEQFESISRDQALVRDIIRVPSVNKTQIVSAGSLWSNCHILTEVVIGRDKDRDNVVNMLLDDSISSNAISVSSIVGIGGVGKTTLAKYAYQDERVKNWFDVHLWVSTTQDFDVQKVLLKILATFEDEIPANCDIVQAYNCFQRAICGKKFLLVLDNVWDQENLWQKWQDLKSLLPFGLNGSKILLTTRNMKVATIMGCVNPYVLGDLTKENSWILFQKIAFTACQEPGLEAIGRDIVKMCPNIPLVIRNIGGLLASKCTVMEWLAFRDDQLTSFSSYGRDIIQTLKLSYNQLDERLKLCVAYCSLFPKGYRYNKDEMVRLWISLGYIKPSYERQRLEDAAVEYMLQLTIQGFFILDRTSSNDLLMHDLMNDLVISVVDFKYKMATDADECEFDERIRHLSLVRDKSKQPFKKVFFSILKLKQLQSLLVLDYWYFEYKFNIKVFDRVFYGFPTLRILSLSDMGIKKVPSSLSELITLRYLNLSYNPITHLPNSITHLVELLSLNVSHCWRLRKFPKGISKLVKLRHFNNKECPALMPIEVASLTELQTLDEYRFEFSEGFVREIVCELNVIINRLTDGVKVVCYGDATSKAINAREEDPETIDKVERLRIYFKEGSSKNDEMMIEALQPNTNTRKLVIHGYKGERLPKWLVNEIHYVENLVEIELMRFEGCKILGSLGRLPYLKRLYMFALAKVEYVEDICCGDANPYAPLFPSLESLLFVRMFKLKRWYKVSNGNSSTSSSLHQDNTLLAPMLGFPKLKQLHVTMMEFVISMAKEFRGFSSLEHLEVSYCQDLKAIPVGIPNLSNLKELVLYKCCKELAESLREPNGEDWPKIKHICSVHIN